MPRPLRIGFDVAQTCGERAGCGWYADALARALAAAGPENNLFLYHHFDGWLNLDTSAGTRLDAPNAREPLRGMGVEEAAVLWREVRAGTRSLPGGPDVVHSNSYQAPPVRPARLVFTVHDVSFWLHPEFHTEANRLLCQQGVLRALAHADGFVFVSEATRRDFERVFPGWLAGSGKPAAIILEGPRALPAPDAAPLAAGSFWLAVGSLEPRKNYGTLLDALELYWARSPQPRPLWIAGGAGWRSEALKERLREAEGKGRLRALGYVPDARLAALYGAAQALVFPSWHEGFGLPVLEAMSQGCPVICSDRASLPEVGGDAALYVDPASAESVCQALLDLEADPARRARLSAAGRRQAARFSWERTARATLDFYQRVLALPPPRC